MSVSSHGPPDEVFKIPQADVKVLVVGGPTVGKSSLIKAVFTSPQVDLVIPAESKIYSPSIVVTTATLATSTMVQMDMSSVQNLLHADARDDAKRVPVEITNVRLEMWDLTVRAEFGIDEEIDQALSHVDAVIFVCSHGSPSATLESLKWVDFFRSAFSTRPWMNPKEVVNVVLANKADLSPTGNQSQLLHRQQLSELCYQLGFEWGRSVSAAPTSQTTMPFTADVGASILSLLTTVLRKTALRSTSTTTSSSSLLTSNHSLSSSPSNPTPLTGDHALPLSMSCPMVNCDINSTNYYLPGDPNGPMKVDHSETKDDKERATNEPKREKASSCSPSIITKLEGWGITLSPHYQQLLMAAQSDMNPG